MQNFKKYWEAMTTTSAVPGAGDDSSTVIMRKKYDRKMKRKDMEKILKRFINIRNSPKQ